ncbi:MAG: tetratricopeptide repeat protein [Elusimicrobiota bacterium]
MPSLGQVGVLERLLSALYSLGFYAGKTLLPTGLSPLYPRPETAQWIEPRFLLTAAGGLLLLALVIRLRKRFPSLAAAAAAYAILLAPVSGLLPFGGALAADRYSYLSCLPWAALAGGGVSWTLARLGNRGRILCAACASALLLGEGWLTLRQIPAWRDSESLWRRAASLDASSAGAQLNLADALEKKGRLEEAEEHYRRAAALAPKRALAKVDLAQLLERRGAGAEALELCARALESEPGDPRSHLCLGRLLEAAGRREEAEAHFQKAFARGTRLRMPAPAQRPALEAALALRRAELSAAPRSAAAHNNLGNALAALGLLQEASGHFRQSLRAGETAAAHYNLGNALALLGRSEEAAAHYGRALGIDPAFEAARANLRKLQWAGGSVGWGSRKR